MFTRLKMNKLYNMDCMKGMALFPDKFFDLAIVDPPYGIGKDGQKKCICKNAKHNRKEHIKKDWDARRPDEKYFNELFRISKNQIIFGANYFTKYIPASSGWIFWDKGQNLNQSDGELAFTSFDRALRRIIINRVELLKENTIHPTQKPRKLYRWLLLNYAKDCRTIIDTHAGSCSSCIEFEIGGYDWIAFEKDQDYFKSAIDRMKRELAQCRMDFHV